MPELPKDSPEGLTRAGKVIEGRFYNGFMCWGVPIGEDEFVRAVLQEKVYQILKEGRHSLEVLGPRHRHAAWQALRLSIWPQFEYWAQNCYPSHTLPAVRVLDEGLLSLLELVCGFSIPQGRDQHGITLATPVLGREQ